MAYIKTTWINNVTKANATNLNKIEDELEALDTDVTQAKTDIEGLDQSVETLATDVSEFTNLIKYDLIVSEAPIKTGRKIDGKDEYVARVNLGSLPNASSKDVTLPFDASGITLIRIDATAYNSATNIWIPIPFSTDTGTGQAAILLVNNVLRILTSTDRSSFTGKADIYFTYNS